MLRGPVYYKLEGVRLNPRPHLCFLYDLKKLGITTEEFIRSIEGWHMDVFEWRIAVKKGGAARRQTKCPWCEEKQKDLISHIDLVHNKKSEDLEVVKMQNALYSQLMKRIKSNKRNYFSHAVLFGSTCAQCVRPRIEGRFGMCALPESARNKMRSLKLLGFSCQSFDSKYIRSKWHCAVIYPER